MRTHTYIVHTHSYAKQIDTHTRTPFTCNMLWRQTSNAWEVALHSTHDTRLLVLFLIPNLHKFYTYFPSCMRYFCAPFHSQIDYLDYHAYFLRISFLIIALSSPKITTTSILSPANHAPFTFVGLHAAPFPLINSDIAKKTRAEHATWVKINLKSQGVWRQCTHTTWSYIDYIYIVYIHVRRSLHVRVVKTFDYIYECGTFIIYLQHSLSSWRAAKVAVAVGKGV